VGLCLGALRPSFFAFVAPAIPGFQLARHFFRVVLEYNDIGHHADEAVGELDKSAFYGFGGGGCGGHEFKRFTDV